jgi:hypothetical protein
MNANHVGSLFPNGFGNFALGRAVTVNVGTVANAVAQIAIVGASSYIVRRITVANANKSIAAANVTVTTSNDGNTSNAVASLTTLSNVTSTTRFQDLTLAAGAATTVYTAGSLYVNIPAAVSGGTCDIAIYGDVVTL